MDKFLFVGIDPGCSTGLMARIEGSRTNVSHTVTFPRDFSTSQQAVACARAQLEVLDWIDDQRTSDSQSVVVGFELFRLQPGQFNSKPEGFSAMWVHAQLAPPLMAIEALTLMRFTPGTAKPSATDARLKSAGLWVEGTQAKRHERDAGRILWCVERKMRNG